MRNPANRNAERRKRGGDATPDASASSSARRDSRILRAGERPQSTHSGGGPFPGNWKRLLFLLVLHQIRRAMRRSPQNSPRVRKTKKDAADFVSAASRFAFPSCGNLRTDPEAPLHVQREPPISFLKPRDVPSASLWKMEYRPGMNIMPMIIATSMPQNVVTPIA